MQISLAARLAYTLDKDSAVSNIAGDDETISYLAGWLGDAVLVENGTTTSFGNDDYIADLDAENIFRYLLDGNTISQASSMYFSDLTTTTRAQVFVGYLTYDTVKDMVYYELIDKDLYTSMNIAASQGNILAAQQFQALIDNEEYHQETIADSYPDTHDFLYSVYNNLNEIGDY